MCRWHMFENLKELRDYAETLCKELDLIACGWVDNLPLLGLKKKEGDTSFYIVDLSYCTCKEDVYTNIIGYKFLYCEDYKKSKVYDTIKSEVIEDLDKEVGSEKMKAMIDELSGEDKLNLFLYLQKEVINDTNIFI